MLFQKKILAVGLLALTIASPVYAQVCHEATSDGEGKANLTCDMRYRDTVVTCDKKNPSDVVGTRPACPKKPMPMIETPKRSYIADYTPLLYAYPRDSQDKTKPYAGSFGIGTAGDTAKTFQMMGKSPPGTKSLAACANQIDIDTSGMSLADQAKAARMQLDNCTNQYILNTAIWPYQKENVKLLSMDDPSNPGAVANLAGECQPLKTFTETKNEYSASTYLEVAWKKLLQDPGYRKNTLNIIPLLPVCLSFDPFGVPCKHEPQLPDGTNLSNPIAPPSPFPEVLLSSIAAVPYEEIVDPTHPFSPRWDFILNDRQYSNPLTAAYTTNSLAIYALHYFYMTDTKNTIFCAGVKKSNESDAQKKKDAEVPVDVLEFRRKPFEEALLRRTTYNVMCYNAPALWTSGTDALFYVAPFSYCFNITGFSFWYPWIFAKDKKCWECFNLNGKVDDESSHPPCTTNYLGKDLKMSGAFPGGFNLFSRTAQCNYPLTKRDDKYNMDRVCKDLRAPYTQLNKLKMRYHNPDDKNDTNGDNVVLKDPGAITASGKKDGALEGMTFKEYFGNHMPYPRLWDTGSSLQRTPNTEQFATDTEGQYTAIVGIGRESAAKVAVNGIPAGPDGKTPEERYTDQRCKAGGWGGMAGDQARSLGSPWFTDLGALGMGNVFLPDPVTSWTEMKLYQSRTLRNVGMSCLGRYEKVFKPGSAENMVLLAAGAEWSKLTITKCAKDTGGRTKNCTDMTLKEYVDAGKPASDTGATGTVYIKQLQNEGWPNSWRGYMAGGPLGGVNLLSENKFPNFGGSGGVNLGTRIGLDNAELGDIVQLPFGAKNIPPVPFTNSAGLAKLALVIETRLGNNSNCEDARDCYIKVLEPDNGKWPDSCGSTDTWGEMKTRYYYKPGHLPEAPTKEYERIGSTKDCEETRLSFCEQSSWSSLPIYRIRLDPRKGCAKKDKAANCDKDE